MITKQSEQYLLTVTVEVIQVVQFLLKNICTTTMKLTGQTYSYYSDRVQPLIFQHGIDTPSYSGTIMSTEASNFITPFNTQFYAE